MTQCCGFKLEHYHETLHAYADAGYTVCSFRDWLSTDAERALVLRHDLDFDDGSTLEMAKLEFVHDASATYFIRLHGRYNPFSYKWTQQVYLLSGDGHEIGLHFEQLNGNAVIEYLDAARAMMEQVYGIPIERLAQHYTATDNIDLSWYRGMQDVTFFGINTPGKYLSDSGGRWREGCFCEWIGREDLLFVNTHPVWWYNECPQENF